MELQGFQFDEEETNLTEEEAQRLVEWIIDHGHTEAEAYEALAYVMDAIPEKEETQ